MVKALRRRHPVGMGFGAKDHSRWRRGTVRLAFGQNAEGRIVAIDAVVSGKACGCVCPACDEPLIARKGRQGPRRRQNHFAHARDRVCAKALETALHKLAKQILVEAKVLLLPPVAAERDGLRKELRPAHRRDFNSARPEAVLHGVVADVLMREGDRDLIVEVLVTHASDEEKIARIRELSISAIEIDLSGLARVSDEPAVRQAVLFNAPRTWLYNPHCDEAERLLDEAIAARAEAQRQARLRQARTLVGHWDALPAPPPGVDIPLVRKALDRVSALELEACIDRPVHGATALLVEPKAWQAVMINALVIQPALGYGTGMLFSPANAVEVLRKSGLINPLFSVTRPEQLLKAALELRPKFRTPWMLANAYLHHIVEAGILERQGKYLRPPPALCEALRQKHRLTRELKERQDDLRERLQDILDEAGDDAVGFDQEAWLQDAALGEAPLACAAAGGESWRALNRRLDELETALRVDRSDVDLVGLPMAGTIQRRAKQREQAAEDHRQILAARKRAQVEMRQTTLRARAWAALGAEAEDWLAKPAGKNHPQTRWEVACESDEMLWNALAALDRRKTDRRLQVEREALARDCLATLWDAAVEAEGEDWAKAFLQNMQPRLGGRRPREVCVDQGGLKQCLKLIPKPRAIRMRR